VDQELVAYFDRRFSELKSELKSESKSELTFRNHGRALGAEIRASAADTRRHFDVVADRLMDKIQLVGRRRHRVDQKLDRFRGEVCRRVPARRPSACSASRPESSASCSR
jgi:hypothetical protein